MRGESCTSLAAAAPSPARAPAVSPVVNTPGGAPPLPVHARCGLGGRRAAGSRRHGTRRAGPSRRRAGAGRVNPGPGRRFASEGSACARARNRASRGAPGPRAGEAVGGSREGRGLATREPMLERSLAGTRPPCRELPPLTPELRPAPRAPRRGRGSRARVHACLWGCTAFGHAQVGAAAPAGACSLAARSLGIAG